jgi:putative ATP-dependent endonuclease of OLD family
MWIEKVRVEGFRLLHNVEIMLEDNSTVIVGRNNSGKTSFTDIFDRFTGETGARFRLEDFSNTQRERFFNAKVLRNKDAKPEDVLAELPTLSLTLTFRYDSAAPNLGPLSPFVIDLEVGSTTAIVRVEYRATLTTIHT